LQSPQKPATAELQQLQQIPITEKIAAQRLQSSSDCRFRQRSHTGSRQHDLFSHRNPPLPLRFRRNCGSTGPVSWTSGQKTQSCTLGWGPVIQQNASAASWVSLCSCILPLFRWPCPLTQGS